MVLEFQFQGLPTIEALLSCEHFLRIAELKVRGKNLGVEQYSGNEANALGFVRRRDSGVRDATAI